MENNEERRRVSARLRDMADSRYCETKNTLVLTGALLAVLGLDAASGTVEDIMRRIADLIEPEPERTCRIKQHRCTNCDHEINVRAYFTNVVLDDGCWTAESRTANFCPNCGAKVISDAD